eukprot:gb/GEZN01006793.1/.p1 GENE.gb/GEZN01006793.1/~~gb/GEZN01006793.1/.p1  ORF type:complete len:373 (-),score=100.30 gb/GEZN01006793.1/:457-1575(-)
MIACMEEEELEFPPSLQNVLDQKTLKWVFVGGKGGVGKTTTSCSLAVALSKVRESVLVISTDPAHNVSDAFSQQFTKTPTLVKGFQNLYAMEIDPTVELDTGDVLDDETKGLMAELASSLPGMDEARSFAELMKQVQSMDYSIIVFDTAPTGHTLRLLSFPSVIQKGFERFYAIKAKFPQVFSQLSSMADAQVGAGESKLSDKIQQTKQTVSDVNTQFRDPARTTFVCVCIPEFLSLFETERLVQELSKYGIDTHNIVVNQVLFPEQGSSCNKCAARVRMQKKYLDQIQELYSDDFHVLRMPLLDSEVRGSAALDAFSQLLITGQTTSAETPAITQAAKSSSPAKKPKSSKKKKEKKEKTGKSKKEKAKEES